MDFLDFFRNLFNPKFEIYFDNGRPSREDMLSLIQELHQRLASLEKKFDPEGYKKLCKLADVIFSLFMKHGDVEAYEHFKNWHMYDNIVKSGQLKNRFYYFHRYFDDAIVFADHIIKSRYSR